MIILSIASARRRMREHQGIPQPRPRLPLWRLVLGELGWALQQLVREPRVLAALLVGAVATIAVLDAAAPGPMLPWPGRVVVGLLAGLALARGVWAWIRRGDAPRPEGPGGLPGVAATEVVAVLVGVVLMGWVLVWLTTLLLA
jgi:hypothetical protein